MTSKRSTKEQPKEWVRPTTEQRKAWVCTRRNDDYTMCRRKPVVSVGLGLSDARCAACARLDAIKLPPVRKVKKRKPETNSTGCPKCRPSWPICKYCGAEYSAQEAASAKRRAEAEANITTFDGWAILHQAEDYLVIRKNRADTNKDRTYWCGPHCKLVRVTDARLEEV